MDHCDGALCRAGTTFHPLTEYAQLLVPEYVQSIDKDSDGGLAHARWAMKSKDKVAVYLRVSTADQNTDAQEYQVLDFCRRRGWRSPHIFRDSASGAALRRPGLESMMDLIRSGHVRHVVTYKLDRLGRSFTHLAVIIEELTAKSVGLICTSQGIDTSTPNPVAQFQLGVLMAVAEFERALIKERTIAGLAVARRHGKRIGRPPLPQNVVCRILKISRRVGGRIRAITKEAGVSPSTVSRVLARALQPLNRACRLRTGSAGRPRRTTDGQTRAMLPTGQDKRELNRYAGRSGPRACRPGGRSAPAVTGTSHPSCASTS